MEIIYDEDLDIDAKMLANMKKAAEIATAGEGLDPELCEISLSVVSPEEIRELNAAYRDKDSVTDVLSFPQYDDLAEIENESEISLGDVVICDEVAHAQAEEYGHSYEREFVYLFVHSVHHLLGYDHMEPDEKDEMRRHEEQVMSAIGITRDEA